MDSPRHEKRKHFRGKPRPGRRMEVRFRLAEPAGSPFLTAVTRNIGIGGAFISTPDPPPPGTVLFVEIKVPTCDDPLMIRAEVRWIAPPPVADEAAGFGLPDDDRVLGPGMGVCFQNVDIDALLELSDYFSSLTGEEPTLG
jgi:Tfp pilus assembly protein PilZ